jgi:uncharacterized protein DUF1549/uncharacterized protein DUF1553
MESNRPADFSGGEDFLQASGLEWTISSKYADASFARLLLSCPRSPPRLPTMSCRLLLSSRLLPIMAVVGIAVCHAEAIRAELIVTPRDVRLSGRLAASQLLVTASSTDVTRDVTYTLEPAGIVDVSPSGFLKPLADGRASLRIELRGEAVTVPVLVERASTAEPVDFERDVQPILSRYACNAGACHGKQRGQNGFQLSLLGFDSDFDYDALAKEGRGRRVFGPAAERSLLLLKPIGELPHGGGKRIGRDSPEYRVLHDWITAGMPRRVVGWAPSPSATVPSDAGNVQTKIENGRAGSQSYIQLTGISVEPSDRILPKQTKQQLRVTAKYSDGSTRDVTRLTAYLSNEAALVGVNETGLLTAGPIVGDTAVMARYLGHIAVCNVAVPHADPVPDDVYAKLPQQNFIDGHVWAKLKTLNLTPSEPCAEHTFLRRAYLDIIGRGPTVDEARQYLDDTSTFSRNAIGVRADAEPTADPAAAHAVGVGAKRGSIDTALLKRREALIDGLLAHPEYAEHWANKWTDLLRPNPYHVGIKATLAYDTWIRDAFRKNKPYDQFVRELITARGSTFRNGNAVMFRDRRSPEDLTTIVSQLFLGVRLECAKCHHHPFEVYGQDEFYSFAAYFAKIGRKGTGISAPISGSEEFIFAGTNGTVKHPLTQAAMTPKPLFGTAPSLEGVDDPREVLAAWITSPENPFFVQVIANRVWADLMGRGLVEPIDDLRATNPPSNAPLLKALGDDFRAQGHDMKKLIRRIATSYVYSLSSLPNERNAVDQRNFSRHYRQRLRAEVLLDTVSLATGVRDDFEAMPAGSRAKELWTARIDSLFLDAFGRQDPNQDPPCERTLDTTIVQSLHLMNSNTLAKKVASDGSRADELAKSDKTPAQIVEEIYLAFYARRPNAAELQTGTSLFAEPNTNRRQATEDLMWALINTPEFVFED